MLLVATRTQKASSDQISRLWSGPSPPSRGGNPKYPISGSPTSQPACTANKIARVRTKFCQSWLSVIRHASPAVRNKLASLARAGAVICGGWEHDASTAAADRVKVHASVNDAFASLELLPDVFVEGRHSLHWTHRRKDVTDIYFVTNQSPREFSGKVDFRVQGRTPELWDAVTATRRSAEFAASGAVTGVKLTLAPWSSTFVVFRQSSQGSGQWLPATTTAILRTLEGPWTVRFHDGRGAPDASGLFAE